MQLSHLPAVVICLFETQDRPDLQQIMDHADAHRPVATAHAAQVVGVHVVAHLEVVHDHGRHGRRGAVDRARRHQDVNLVGTQACA